MDIKGLAGRSPPGGRDWRWPVTAAAAVLAFLWVVNPLVTGEMAPVWDADGFFIPYYTLLADFTRAGKLLLWNPWTSGGSPDHVEPQVATLGPHFLLSAFITGGGEAGYRAHWLACWLLGLLGMLALGRRLGAPPVAAGAVALAFALSGPFTGHAQHLSFMFSYALFPFALCRMDAALEERSRLAALQGGALWGLSAIGGYPGVLLITGGLLAFWVAARVVLGGAAPGPDFGITHRLPAGKALALVAWFFGAGVLVMMPAALPMVVDGAGFSDRAGTLARDVVTRSNALHPRALITFFSPHLASLPVTNLWPYTDPSSCSLYMGVVPLMLAVHALYSRPRSALRWWLFGIAALCVALALSRVLPFRGWLYDLVPPTRYVRHASLYRLGTVFALTVLACLGASHLFRERGRGAARWVPLLVAVGLLAAAVGIHESVTAAVPSGDQQLGEQHLWVAWGGLVLVVGLACVLAGAARRWTLVIGLAALSLYDARTTFRLGNTIGSAPMVPAWRKLEQGRVRTLDMLAGGQLQRRLVYSNDSTGYGPGPTNKNLLHRVPVFVGYAPLNNQIHFRWASHPMLAERVLGPERTYFSPSAVQGPATMEAFEAFLNGPVALGRMPLVLHDRAGMLKPKRAGAGSGGSTDLGSRLSAAPDMAAIPVRWRSYAPDRLLLEVDAPQDGWLLVTDRWARGWRALVDGAEVQVEAGNFLFRALRITAGRHTVEMTYHPSGLPWLMLACWGTLAGIVGATVHQWWRSRRRRSTAQ